MDRKRDPIPLQHSLVIPADSKVAVSLLIGGRARYTLDPGEVGKQQVRTPRLDT